MGQLEVHAHLKIRPGELDGFKAQAAEIMRLSRERDTQTIRYDWYVNEDGTECEVHESYLGAQGLVEHNEHVRDARAVLFERYAYDHRMTAFGEVTEELRRLADKHAGGIGVYSFLEGLGTAPGRVTQRAGEAEMGHVRTAGCDLYVEEAGDGVPILLIPPAGATAGTWGPLVEELARVGRVITYDRRGYVRSGGEPVRSTVVHTADAAAILRHLQATPAVAVGTSAGATIAVDLAVRYPDLLRAVVAHETAWRARRHLPNRAQAAAIARLGWLALRGRYDDAADTLLRAAYSYRDGGTAWDAFPAEWRRIGRENARAALWDFWNSIGSYPEPRELATIEVPVVCSYGSRSPANIVRLTRGLASAIPTARTHQVEGAGHAAPFDATAAFAELVADAVGTQKR